MDRLRQPAMRVGGGVPRERPDDPALAEVGGQLLTRSWAITRLVVLVVLCGLGAAVTAAIAFAVLKAAAESV